MVRPTRRPGCFHALTLAPVSDTVAFMVPFLCRRLLALFRCTKAEVEVAEKEKEDEAHGEHEAESEAGSEERKAEDRWAARSRQLRAAGGLIGVYVAWACFSYFTFGASLQRTCIRISHSPPQSTECVLAVPLHRPTPRLTPSPSPSPRSGR